MASTVRFKRKTYTRWDDTDNLKRMKDADILAEKKRPTTDYGKIAGATAAGTVAAATGGAIIGGGKGLFKGAPGMGRGKAMLKTGGRWGKYGAVIGGTLAATSAYAAGRKKAEENEFYNKRLQYAQKQALRREKKDWKTNMTQRDGYSY